MSKYTVQDLAKFLKKSKDNGSPFVLFTGAGCSKSAGIPLAGELVEIINKDFELELKGLSEAERKDYGKCMAALVKEDRRKLISGYISEAKINWAHIAIALLIDQGYFQRVLTFNFDNLLARSCGLLGIYPATYDLTAADLDLHNLIVEPAVVHIHGQSHGFTLLNTDEETSNHAESLKHFIASTLNQSPTLFVGYSGNADAFFPILKEKYKGQQRLFWSGRGANPPEHLKVSLLEKYGNFAHYIESNDADHLFIELAKELECFPPEIFTNPYKHLLEELSHVTDYPLSKLGHTDLFALIKKQLLKDSDEFEKDVEDKVNTKELLLGENYEELVKLYKEGKITQASDLEDVAAAFFELAYYKQCHFEDDVPAAEYFSEVAGLYEQAIKLDPQSIFFNNLGSVYINLAVKNLNLVERKKLCEQAIDNFNKAINLDTRDIVPRSNKIRTLTELGYIQKIKGTDNSYYDEALAECLHIFSNKSDNNCYNDSYFIEHFAQLVAMTVQAKKQTPKLIECLDETVRTLEENNHDSMKDALTVMYMTKFRLTNDPTYLNKAREIRKSSNELYYTYNTLCLFALSDMYDECTKLVEEFINKDILFDKFVIDIDDDFDSIRDFDWFLEYYNKCADYSIGNN